MYSGKETSSVIRQVMFVALIIALAFVIVSQLTYFVSSVLGAATIYMLLRTPHRKLQARGWRKGWSTAFLLAMTVLLVFILGGALFGVVYAKVKDFHPQAVIDAVNNIHNLVLEKTGYNIFSKEMVDKAIRSAGDYLPQVFSTAGSVVTNGLMMIFVLYFMLQGGSAMEERLRHALPLSDNSVCLIEAETENMVVSNAVGIPVIMLGQGLVAGLGYWIFGAGDPVVWGLLTGIFGLVPVVGTAAVWIPLAVNLLIGGNIWQGIALLVYGAAVISVVDNVIRMLFLKRFADIHPLIAIFGIILGVNLIGFWGIIFGPLIISGFLLLIKIYKKEFLSQ